LNNELGETSHRRNEENGMKERKKSIEKRDRRGLVAR
jgi:hypothetical protein